MSYGTYSPLMLIATNGLILNQGLDPNPNLITGLDQYTSVEPVADILLVIANAIPAVSANVISQSTFNSIVTLGNTTFPALTDAIPSDYTANMTAAYGNTIYGSTTVIDTQINRLLGNINGSGYDLGIFTQIYYSSEGYRVSTNTILNSVTNSDLISSTFTDMNALTSGGVSNVNADFEKFGADLRKLGSLIDLGNLANLGQPAALLQQMAAVGGVIPAIYTALLFAGVTQSDITESNTLGTVTPKLNKKIYTALTTITGSDLSQILNLLAVTTPGIATAADLLDPLKIFPTSYGTLVTQISSNTATSPNQQVQVLIYTGTTVNSALFAAYPTTTAYIELSRVIPPDQAAANIALRNSLGQVKSIKTSTLPAFANTVSTLESSADFSLIGNLSSPIPTSVTNSLVGNLATGATANATLTIYDFMGSLTGNSFIEPLANLTADITTLNNTGNLTVLTNASTGLYAYMNLALATPSGNVIIPTGPAAGTYANAEIAFTGPGVPSGIGLLPATIAEIANIANSYPTIVSTTTSNIDTMMFQIDIENNNLSLAGVDWTVLAEVGNLGTTGIIQSFGSGLHDIGKAVSFEGPAQFVEAIANTATQTGQAIVATMREARNIATLNNSGVQSDTQIPATGR